MALSGSPQNLIKLTPALSNPTSNYTGGQTDIEKNGRGVSVGEGGRRFID